jgi:DNA-binding response OmpR family regulator
VVDDDPDYIEAVKMTLSHESRYQVTSASNGDQALEVMRTNPPDLVLLDVMMATPLDGVNLAQKMSADKTLASIPVIMISSIDQSEHANLLPDNLRIPIDAWIAKPIDPEHLLKTIRRFIS